MSVCRIGDNKVKKEVRMGRRRVTNEAFMSASTTGLDNPAGLIAGARATSTFTFSFSCALTLNAANACAVPWLNPT